MISSGNLLKNGNFHGTIDPWILNSSGTGVTQDHATTPNSLGIEEPSVGWFYGFDGNSLGGYNLDRWQAFRQ